MYWKYIFTRTMFIIHDIYKSCQSLLHTYENLLINTIIEKFKNLSNNSTYTTLSSMKMYHTNLSYVPVTNQH